MLVLAADKALKVPEALLLSLVGFAVVFIALLALIIIIKVIVAFSERRKAPVPATSNQSESVSPAQTPKETAQVPAATAPAPQPRGEADSIGYDVSEYKITFESKVYDVSIEQEAAMARTPRAAGSVARAAPAMRAAAPAMRAAPTARPAPAARTAPEARPTPASTAVKPGSSDKEEVVTSPLPGTILGINVTAGQSVKRGQVLITIEAMKMENEVLAPCDGVIKQIITSKGASVSVSDPLLTLI